MLSKMARIEEKNISTDYENMKLNELKPVLRKFGLRMSGNKPEIIERIKTHVLHSKNTIQIQKISRGFLARLWVRLKKGDGSMCVNDSDFFTLEPIDEISFYYYMHYIEEKSKTSYAFNISSLCSMISKSGKFENPYTRENMKTTCGIKMIRIIKLTNILFPHNELMADLKDIYILDKIQIQPQQQYRQQLQRQQQQQQQPVINFDRRITELFIAIDTLGNYTHKEWFINLTNSQLCTFVLRLNSLWITSTNELRNKINPVRSPFSIENTGVTRMSMERSLDENRIITLKIGEALVYGGIDNEHKIMGAMFFLSGLTVVSYPARVQMPWLYDNYNYHVARL